MRGKAAGRKTSESANGITPAYAGKRCTPSEYLEIIKDHPRLCGEKSPFNFYQLYQMGSPPPMRGKEVIPTAHDTYTGITPAYAGKRQLVLA